MATCSSAAWRRGSTPGRFASSMTARVRLSAAGRWTSTPRTARSSASSATARSRRPKADTFPGVRQVLLALLSFSFAAAAAAADVHVLISAGFYRAYSELAPAFERASGHRLVTARGPSMGDSPEAIPARLARGERADVVVLEGGSADELGKNGLVRLDSKVLLALAQTGLVVRAGAPVPDIG